MRLAVKVIEKKSQTIVCWKAESAATIAPGNVSSKKSVAWLEGQMLLELFVVLSFRKYWSRALERAGPPIAFRDLIGHVTEE